MWGSLGLIAAALLVYTTFRAVQPGYRRIRLYCAGDVRRAVDVVYPASWEVLGTDFSAADRNRPLRGAVDLAPRHTTGLQALVDRILRRAEGRGSGIGEIQVVVNEYTPRGGIDAEMARLAPLVRQSLTAGGSLFPIQKSECRAGPLIEAEALLPGGALSTATDIFVIYPPSPPHQSPFEIIVRYETNVADRAVMHRVAMDVVSRVRVVVQK